jgi:hypothetical protein
MAQAAALSWDSQGIRDGTSQAADATVPATNAVTHHLSTAATAGGMPQPHLAAYGGVRMTHRADLLRNLDVLSSEADAARGIRDEQWPRHMEQYGQSFGLILYSTQLQAGGSGTLGAAWHQPGQQQASPQAAAVTGKRLSAEKQPQQLLNFTAHDYAKVLLGSQVIGSYWRNTPAPVPLPDPTLPGMEQEAYSSQQAGSPTSLHLLVEAMGRNNFAPAHTKFLDLKGLVGNVTLDGVPLANWTVQPIELGSADLAKLEWSQLESGTHSGSRHHGKLAAGRPCQQASNGFRPTLYKGSFLVPAIAPAQERSSSQQGAAGSAHPADTFIHMGGWDKGVVWVNGHCLGRYWQSQGPQYSLYCPGPWLRPGADNEVVVLELSEAPKVAEVRLVGAPGFGAASKALMLYAGLALLLAVAGLALALTMATQYSRLRRSPDSACSLVCNGDRGKPSSSQQHASVSCGPCKAGPAAQAVVASRRLQHKHPHGGMHQAVLRSVVGLMTLGMASHGACHGNQTLLCKTCSRWLPYATVTRCCPALQCLSGLALPGIAVLPLFWSCALTGLS